MTNWLFYLILYIFRWVTFRGKNPSRVTGKADVAMINPLNLKILSLPKGLPLSDKLRCHEQCHARQVIRDGRLWFIVTYLFYNLRYGYRANPYEMEARAAE
jgi:hypothetical protein